MVEKLASRKREIQLAKRGEGFQKELFIDEKSLQSSEDLDEKVLLKGKPKGKDDEHVEPRGKQSSKMKFEKEKEVVKEERLESDGEQVTRKRTVVHRVKEEPHVECIVEKPFIEENHMEAVEEFRERSVYEIHETVNEEIIYEESQQENYVLPTRYEEIDQEKQRLAKQELDYVRAVKQPERIREETEVRRIHQKPMIIARYEEDRVEIHERPIVRKIHKKPIYKFFEQPVVRTIYEPPVLRIHREDSKLSETDKQENRESYGMESHQEQTTSSYSSSSHAIPRGEFEKIGELRISSTPFQEKMGRVGGAWYSSYVNGLRYMIFLMTTWITLWIAAPIGVHLASQFRLFGTPSYRTIKSNRNLLLATTLLCLFGYFPGMVFALGYFTKNMLREVFHQTSSTMRKIYSSSSTDRKSVV